jgi:hypothetical protein
MRMRVDERRRLRREARELLSESAQIRAVYRSECGRRGKAQTGRVRITR